MPLIHKKILLFCVTLVIYAGLGGITFYLSSNADELAWSASSVVLWGLAWIIFGRFEWIHLMCFPAFLLLPAELMVQHFFATGLTPHIWGTILETSPREALEFVGNRWLEFLLLPLCFALLWWVLWLGWRKNRRDELNTFDFVTTLSMVMRSVIFIVVSVLIGFAILIGQDKDELPSYLHSFKSTVDPSGRRFDLAFLAEPWPFGVYVQLTRWGIERFEFSRQVAQKDNFHFGATSQTNEARTIVLVIGESSRADHWGINGYQRNTTPLLQQRLAEGSELINLPDFLSPISATRLSVPIMLTRKMARDAVSSDFSETSLISALRDAGFKTWWLSNQMSYGKFDTPITVYGREAEVVRHFNLGSYSGVSPYDGVLLAPLEDALRDPAPKKLIILHTLGSHWNYRFRYPAAFEIDKPALAGHAEVSVQDRSLRAEMVNAYDNSIRYTDWLLDQVMTRLRDRSAALLYASDHGQLLYDGQCNLALHGHNTYYDFKIPALLWTSAEYRMNFPNTVYFLRKNATARLNTENIFPTILDLAQVKITKAVPVGETNPRFSIAANNFKSHVRWVDSYGWTNFDNAVMSGSCKEMKAPSAKSASSVESDNSEED